MGKQKQLKDVKGINEDTDQSSREAVAVTAGGLPAGPCSSGPPAERHQAASARVVLALAGFSEAKVQRFKPRAYLTYLLSEYQLQILTLGSS